MLSCSGELAIYIGPKRGRRSQPLCELEHIFQCANRPNILLPSHGGNLPRLSVRREWRALFSATAGAHSRLRYLNSSGFELCRQIDLSLKT
jgi:hypothetical protein